jgi:4-amino-4-deoxy-L-arabinose transferase-like glycosyltransferase
MTSRRPENRLWRTREQGFLLLSALWTIFFFSLSQSKLPTYILPSFPPICLLMGVLLERKVLDRCWPTGQLNLATLGQFPTEIKRNSSATFLDRLTRRAPFELLIGIIAISIAVYYFDKSSFAVLSRIGLAALAAGLLAVAAILQRSANRLAWVSFGLIAFLIVMLGAHQLIPAISKTRSVHLATRNLGSTAEFDDAPVVFFGRETYGAELTLDLGRVTHFHPYQYYSMVRFLEQNPTAIIISSENPIKSLREDLPWTIELEECEEGRRHLFISRPNVKAIAREQATNPYR